MVRDDNIIGADLFSASAERVVSFLKEATPLPEWTVNRVAGGEQVHLYADDNDILQRGMRVDWQDTYCIRMTNGAARVVPDALADIDYSNSPHADDVRAYAGIPLTDEHGNVFGTLCGIGTEPLSSPDDVDSRLVELMGELLSTQLALARAADHERQSAKIASALAQTDSLTGLVNRRGWDVLVADAQQRVSVYGDPVAVAVIDLDGLKAFNDAHGHRGGDDLLIRAAAALRSAAKDTDQIARYGGDEFSILTNDVSPRDLGLYYNRFAQALEAHGVAASIGYAAAKVGTVSVLEAFADADSSMYAVKRSRKDRRPTSSG